jgi:L-alanine-DL-glutamate epimerase-like enolase superfamily enzyme
LKIKDLRASAYTIPTDRPEADGTIEWNSTTLVVVDAVADSGEHGLGLTYGAKAASALIDEKLGAEVVGRPVEDIRSSWRAMVRSVRNVGRQGIASTAISAVDIALWDLKARVHRQPLFELLGPVRREVPAYGSGGFTSYTERELIEQLCAWIGQGIPRVKMKIGVAGGSRPDEDVARARAVRRAIGPAPELFIDANGAYDMKTAVNVARRMADEAQVTYFEEPVSSDHLSQLAEVRRTTPMAIAAGEYGYDPWYFHDMLSAGAVDIIQADVTRCLGITGWLEAAHIAHSFAIPLSAHCGPTVHAHVACAAPQISHIEYFWDHLRIDDLLFDGAPQPVRGCLAPDSSRPGLGIDFKRVDAERYR